MCLKKAFVILGFSYYCKMLNYNNLSQYERRISRRLKKHVCKDISSIIKNYILLPTFPLLKKVFQIPNLTPRRYIS